MKIEKGKLYLDKENKEVRKAHTDLYDDNGIYFTDKIAVHCPTEDDWEYVDSKLGIKSGYCNPFIYKRLDGHNCWFGLDKINSECLEYYIISIDQFKQFYPESVISNKTDDNVQNNDPINPTHYNQYAIQPLDYIEANGFDFFEGNVIKYVSRYKQKNGLEDLKKARVYLDKLINRYEK